AVQRKEGNETGGGIVSPIMDKGADVHAIGLQGRGRIYLAPLMVGDAQLHDRTGSIELLDLDGIGVAPEDDPVVCERLLVDVETLLGIDHNGANVLAAANDAGNGGGGVAEFLLPVRVEIILAEDRKIFLHHLELDHGRNIVQAHGMGGLDHFQVVNPASVENG